MEELISWLQKKYPYHVQQMKACSHHYSMYDQNPYHLEDDVWSHTMMVCQQAKDSPTVVQMAALLHDIGKPATRAVNYEKKRVSFYGHEGMSAWMSLEVTRDYGMTKHDQAVVFGLIAMHTEMFKTKPEKMAIRLTGWKDAQINNYFNLVNCDSAGRFCKDVKTYTIDPNTIPAKPCIDLTERTFLMLVGPPCSGKSTWASKNANGAPIISRDDIVDKYAEEHGLTYSQAFDATRDTADKDFDLNLRAAIKAKKDIIVDRTNMSGKSRNRLLNQLPKEYKKVALIFLTPFDTIYHRDLKRTNRELPKNIWQTMVKRFSMPLYDTFDDLKFIFPKDY